MDSLTELPEKGGQQQVVQQGSPGRAQLVWTGDGRTVHAHQEDELRKAESQSQLSVDLV